MVNHEHLGRLVDLLFYRFERDDTSLFALLDSARDPRVYDWIRCSGLAYDCLFAGRLSADLLAASPFLLKIEPGSAAVPRLIEMGWGRSWGVFLAARAGLYDLRRHLRRLLQVRTEARETLFFRYYDPRVLRAFLPTCDRAQLAEFFGPIQRFDLEETDSAKLRRFRRNVEPSTPTALRSWTYALSENRNADDDR